MCALGLGVRCRLLSWFWTRGPVGHPAGGWKLGNLLYNGLFLDFSHYCQHPPFENSPKPSTSRCPGLEVPLDSRPSLKSVRF